MASLRPSSTSLGILLLASVSISLVKSSQAAPFALPHPRVAFLPYVALDVRGGSTQQLQDQDDDDTENNEEEDPEVIKKREALRKYRMEQQMLMQLRSTFLSEALAKRGLPMTTLLDVSTAEGDQPPEKVDWDCAISTEDDPKTCLFSFDAEPNTKVVAPLGTTQWISLSALNRLRRTDPTKVEPMWHSQYAILKSWFGDDSEYSMLQHCGPKGLVLSLLLDHLFVFKGLLTTAILLTSIVFLPFLDFALNRILVSSTVWMHWPQWARFVHAALPLKLLLGQMAWKALSRTLGKVEARVKDILVEVECSNLEETIPLTVGPGSEVPQGDDTDLGSRDEMGIEDKSDFEDVDNFEFDDDDFGDEGEDIDDDDVDW